MYIAPCPRAYSDVLFLNASLNAEFTKMRKGALAEDSLVLAASTEVARETLAESRGVVATATP